MPRRTQNALGKIAGANGRRLLCLLGVALAAAQAGCFERKQTAVINPDGSGKMVMETLVVVPPSGAGKEKSGVLAFGKQVAASFINNTRGVDAWADVEVSEAPGGKAKIVGTAYFPDLNKLKFDMPIEFVWKRDLDGASLLVQRTRSTSQNAVTSEAQLKTLVATAQKQYQDGLRNTWRMSLSVASLDMTFELPGEVQDATLFKRDGNSVAIVIDGKKAADALDKFMSNEEALTAMFKAGKDLPANDDIMLESMYGAKGPIFARTKLAVDAKPVFDYKLESLAAQFKQAKMLEEAGIELIPKFTVTPATRPAPTAPARGR